MKTFLKSVFTFQFKGKIDRSVVYSSLGFVFIMGVIQLVRDRSLWLDESFVYNGLAYLSPWELLTNRDGSVMGQIFPRFYVFLSKLAAAISPLSTRAPRILPMIFGLLGFYVWVRFFHENYMLKKKMWAPFVIAVGLLISNAYGIYYIYELKQYSAEFFFSGLFFLLYFSEDIVPKNKLMFLGQSMVLSTLFCYGTNFLILAILTLAVFNKDDRNLVANNWKTVMAVIFSGLIVGGYVFYVDYIPALNKASNAYVDYWGTEFISGPNINEIFSQFVSHFNHFIYTWWKTEYGIINETFFSTKQWFVLPHFPVNNVDFRHFIEYGTLFIFFYTLIQKLCQKKSLKDPIVLGLILILIMAVSSLLKIYPWKSSRLTLYAMPIVAMIITEVFVFLENLLSKIPKPKNLDRLPALRNLIWLPIALLVLRNVFYIFGAISFGDFMGNIKNAMKYVDPVVSNTVYMGLGVGHILRNNRKLHNNFNLLYDDQNSIETLKEKTDGKIFYVLWSHSQPAFENGQYIIEYFETSHYPIPIYDPPKPLRYGLILMKPK